MQPFCGSGCKRCEKETHWGGNMTTKAVKEKEAVKVDRRYRFLQKRKNKFRQHRQQEMANIFMDMDKIISYKTLFTIHT